MIMWTKCQRNSHIRVSGMLLKSYAKMNTCQELIYLMLIERFITQSRNRQGLAWDFGEG